MDAASQPAVRRVETLHAVPSLTPAAESTRTLKVVVNGSVAGNRRTRDRMRVIIEALGSFLEGGGTLTGTWATDRANLGLGPEYANDGFGTAFTLSATTFVLRSAGADRAMNSADDLTS